jgi:predicted phosphodiesterase
MPHGSILFFIHSKLGIVFLLTSFLLIFNILVLSSNVFADFNFAAAGDWGCTSNTGNTVNNIKPKAPERVFALGDYSYKSTATCWLDKISDIKTKTRITIGNHDDDSDEDFSKYMSAFGLSKTYYSFNYNNVHVLVMDSDRVSYSSGSSQYNFVKNDLTSASQNSNIKWIIVYLHKPFYTSPNTCSSSSCSNTGSEAKALRSAYHAMFDKYGVDVVLQGHVHNYQRTYPVSYSGSSTPKVTTSCSTSCNDPKGEFFVIVGTGGINFHALSGKSSFVKYQQDDRFGALNIIITNDGYKLIGKYYSNGGSKLDEFSIVKSGSTTLNAYSFGPSLTLSGENAELQDGDNGATPQGVIKEHGKGLGLNCAHFTQQGPLRCR